MLPGIEHMAALLREARTKKGLSQRELSANAGVPQSHISKIEQGAVDLRVSSLIELARALDLEVTLVPRPAVPAVQSIVRTTTLAPAATKENRLALRDLSRLQEAITHNPSALHLKPDEIGQLRRQLSEIAHFQLSKAEQNQIRSVYKTVQDYLTDQKSAGAVREALSLVKGLRNSLAHRVITPSAPEPAQPAYTLDEDDNA
jgi:transcriptional regulator with XRE-family HTH domain